MIQIIRTTFLLALLSTFLQNSNCEANFCFDCAGKTDPFACDVIKKCNPNEKCFSTSYFLDTDPTQLWDFGCKDKSFCGLIDYASTNGRRSEMSKPRRYIHRNSSQSFPVDQKNSGKVGDDVLNKTKRDFGVRVLRLTSCNDCCRGSFCNRIPCDEESQKVEPKGLVCHSCAAVQDPAMCTRTARCIVGEACAVWTLDNGLISLGCKAKAMCDAEGNNLLYGKRDIEPEMVYREKSINISRWNLGLFESPVSQSLHKSSLSLNNKKKRFLNVAKRQAAISYSGCRQCCLDNLCASNYCSKINTLPPGVVTVTTPAPTLTPLRVRVVPVIVSTFEGDNATFACDVSGLPPLTVRYSRTFDSNSTTVRIPSCDDQSSTPVLNKTCHFLYAKLSESGQVSCSVTDGYGQTRNASARLLVEPYRNNLRAIVSPADTDMFAGNATDIECSINGVPKPFYSWFRNVSGSLVPLGKDLDYNITSNGDSSVLQVTPDAAGNFDGSYICQGNNRLEILNLPFTLNTVTRVTALNTLSDASIDASRKDFTFSCTFKSYPPPLVSWDLTTPTSQIITLTINSSSTTSVTQDRVTTSKAVVSLDVLKKNNITSVKCTGDNGFYTNYSQAKIKLLQPPRITTPSKKYDLTYGQLLSLECEAEGDPKPYVSWNFVDIYDNPQILQGADLKNDGTVLEVAHIRSSGKFTCYASNSLGSDSVSFEVTVM